MASKLRIESLKCSFGKIGLGTPSIGNDSQSSVHISQPRIEPPFLLPELGSELKLLAAQAFFRLRNAPAPQLPLLLHLAREITKRDFSDLRTPRGVCNCFVCQLGDFTALPVIEIPQFRKLPPNLFDSRVEFSNMPSDPEPLLRDLTLDPRYLGRKRTPLDGVRAQRIDFGGSSVEPPPERLQFGMRNDTRRDRIDSPQERSSSTLMVCTKIVDSTCQFAILLAPALEMALGCTRSCVQRGRYVSGEAPLVRRRPILHLNDMGLRALKGTGDRRKLE
jgi:hypothetical protein